jgi:hypothetical protein
MRYRFLLEQQELGTEDESSIAQAELFQCYGVDNEQIIDANGELSVEKCGASDSSRDLLMANAEKEKKDRSKPGPADTELSNDCLAEDRKNILSEGMNIQSIALELDLGQSQVLKIKIEIAA